MGECWTRRDKGKKFEVCPICGKKGIYENYSYAGISVYNTCRYCKSNWTVRERGEPCRAEHIQKRIEQERKNYQRKLT